MSGPSKQSKAKTGKQQEPAASSVPRRLKTHTSPWVPWSSLVSSDARGQGWGVCGQLGPSGVGDERVEPKAVRGAESSRVVRFGCCIELDLTLGAGKWLQGRYMPMLPVRVPSLASLVVLQVHLDTSESCLLCLLATLGQDAQGEKGIHPDIVAQQTHRYYSRSVEQR